MMRAMGKGHQEMEDYEDDDFGSRKEGPSSTSNNSNSKDAKNSDKASAIRSKHSVTEQRRRSKINERFQILRDLVPHSDQKRDTASFLLEVIEYVQYLQEKVQKFDGSYQGWNQSEPTKLIPWRNSHWRVPNFVGQPQAAKNGPGAAASFPANLDENNNISLGPNSHTNSQNPLEPESSSRDEGGANKGIAMPIPLPACVSAHGRSDGAVAHPLQIPVPNSPLTHCSTASNAQNEQEELVVEGGTINIRSAYSQGLLNTVAEALQHAGLDLSQASISVQIDIGKRANIAGTTTTPISKVYENPHSSNLNISHHRDTGRGEDSDQAQKRLKTHK